MGDRERRVRYRLPDVIEDSLNVIDAEDWELPTSSVRRVWRLPMASEILHYDLVASEDENQIILETRLCDVTYENYEPDTEFLDGLLQLNTSLDYGKIGVISENEESRSIHYIREFPKRGLPSDIIESEFATFDLGVKRLFVDVHTLARDTETELIVPEQRVVGPEPIAVDPETPAPDLVIYELADLPEPVIGLPEVEELGIVD